MTRFARFPPLLALAAAYAPAVWSMSAQAQAQEPAPRYVFVPIEAGALRLNTETGEVSLCAGDEGAGSCTPVREEPQASADEVEELRGRVASLEERMAALEDRGSGDDLASETESLDQVMVLADRMMRRFIGIVRDIKEDVERGDL